VSFFWTPGAPSNAFYSSFSLISIQVIAARHPRMGATFALLEKRERSRKMQKSFHGPAQHLSRICILDLRQGEIPLETGASPQGKGLPEQIGANSLC
jgi:hypothetical protein